MPSFRTAGGVDGDPVASPEAIVAATHSGVRQRDIVTITGYSRESVRRILRAASIDPPATIRPTPAV